MKAMKQKFNVITSTCVPLPLENVDTDQIIPARFLKATDKKGFGDNLFSDWRYDKDGNLNKDFRASTIPHTVDVYWLPEKTSVRAAVVNMPHGR
jgi:3-isopropylmalate dehydratase small subunit